MKRTTLYVIIVILVLIDAFALYKARVANNKAHRVIEESFLDKYAAESLKNVEKIILDGSEIISRLESVNTSKPNIEKVSHVAKNSDSVNIYFLYQGDDCTNCIVQTWEMITKLRENNTSKIKNIKSYFFKNGGAELDNLLTYNNINIPTSKYNFNKLLEKFKITETPQVIISNSQTNTILDAYQPEPNNYVRQSAFRNKWDNILSTL